MNELSQPPRRRIGLVLEGGGAKGAYAFGWLMEFAARGVKFDAVAGTSVGALNAILWATHKIDAGHQLWSSISEQTTLSIRRPRWFWSMVVVPQTFRRLVAERVTNMKNNNDAPPTLHWSCRGSQSFPLSG
jgi:predicted acylesterase/phospholipase RssA